MLASDACLFGASLLINQYFFSTKKPRATKKPRGVVVNVESAGVERRSSETLWRETLWRRHEHSAETTVGVGVGVLR